MECREWLVSWLNDAYAMEEAMVNTLENQVDRLRERRSAQTAVRAHMEHTKSQSECVKRCLEILGEKPVAPRKSGRERRGSPPWTRAVEDKEIKELLADYGNEHLAVASYRALVQAATLSGEQQVATLCQEMLLEEEQMAHTLSRNLDNVVARFLRSRVAVGA